MRLVKRGSGNADHTAKIPLGFKAFFAALRPLGLYKAPFSWRVKPSGPLSTSSKIVSKVLLFSRIN